ncbi:UV excision repair protein (RadW) [Ophiocordyceps camponoti-floridani]|uniref:UV excision repair protein (RadW) n=1 Tax=Ophiocordyceps camponoti-floridani TaxID=2030778 RepID=A0A8H4VB07_9HYPO|nr:UV excision repair protein (RadW) [Ophiocordyceps camponoti-floridani]
MSRAAWPVLGSTLALLATSTVLCLQINIVVNTTASPLRPATAVAGSLQFFVLAILWWLAVSRILHTGRATHPNLTFGLGLFACALAAAVSAASLVYLRNAGAESEAVAQLQTRLLVATSVAVTFATGLQLASIISHFIASREPASLKREASEMPAEQPTRRLRRIKSIPYSQTKSSGDETAQEKMASPPLPPSPVVTTTPKGFVFTSPFARAVRSSSFKQKSTAPKKQRRRASEDSDIRRTSLQGSSFDSWDTSSVDIHNRQVVLEMSTPSSAKQQSLETIPASPSHSRRSSVGSPTDPGFPQSLRTSRSLSHGTLKHREEARPTPASSIHELHIHPLFRSDSQDPPPLASPGTSVVASPIAGQVITRRESSKSLGGMLSGSTSGLHSPLAHQTCFESSEPTPDGSHASEEDSEGERPTTAPVPPWLLTQERDQSDE